MKMERELQHRPTKPFERNPVLRLLLRLLMGPLVQRWAEVELSMDAEHSLAVTWGRSPLETHTTPRKNTSKAALLEANVPIPSFRDAAQS